MRKRSVQGNRWGGIFQERRTDPGALCSELLVLSPARKNMLHSHSSLGDNYNWTRAGRASGGWKGTGSWAWWGEGWGAGRKGFWVQGEAGK